MPEWNTISISGYHIREAGSTAVQELAFTFANAIAYIEAAIAAGLAVDAFAPRLSFFFNSHSDFLEEIAKFRAARRIYAHLMRDRFGAQDPRSLMLRFHVQTAGSTLTAQQPDVNIVRTALQAMAAVLGGAQSLHTNSRDEALALPTEESARIALRTQQIIAHESGRHQYRRPGGRQRVHRSADRFDRARRARIPEAHRRRRAERCAPSRPATSRTRSRTPRTNISAAIESGERVVVGVNRFQQEDERVVPTFRLDPALERVAGGAAARGACQPQPERRRGETGGARAGGARRR